MRVKDKNSHLYVVFRIDGVEVMYKADYTITSTSMPVIKEVIERTTRDIEKYVKKHGK